MTIASEIQRIQNNIANAYDALEAKGATLPVNENSDNLSSTITSIPAGGGDTVTATNNTGSAVSSGDKVFIEPVYNGYSILTTTEYSYRQFDLQGSPTINDTNKTVSQMSQYNYVKVVKQFDFSQPWEFQTGFNYLNSWYGSGGTNQFLWSGDTGSEAGMNNAGFTFRATRFDDTTKKALLFDIIGQTSLGTDPSVLPLTGSGDYWIKIGWTGTEYYAMYSTDKTNWTHFQGNSDGSSASPYQSATPLTQTGSFVAIGNLLWVNTMYWRGTIYLGDTQFLSNGYPVWKAYETGIQIPKADSYMGFAQENIPTSGSYAPNVLNGGTVSYDAIMSSYVADSTKTNTSITIYKDKSFEGVFKIKKGTSSNTVQFIQASNQSTYFFYNKFISNDLYGVLYVDGSERYNSVYVSSNDWIYIAINYSPSDHICHYYYSTDKTNWTQIYQYDLTNTWFSNSSDTQSTFDIYFGCKVGGTWDGQIDFKECYFTVDSATVWNGATAISPTGEILTLLGED